MPSVDRRTYLGGGVAASLMGEGYETPRQLWEWYTQPSDGPQPSARWQTQADSHKRRGLLLEPLGMQWFRNAKGGILRRWQPRFVRWPQYEKLPLGGHPDFGWRPGRAAHGERLVEMKCPNVWFFRSLAKQPTCPRHFYWQALHYMICQATREPAYVCIFSGEDADGRVWEVLPNDVDVRRYLDRAREFWHCVQTKTPTPAEWEPAELISPEQQVRAEPLRDDAILALVHNYAEAKGLAHEANSEKELAYRLLVQALGTREGTYDAGRYRVTAGSKAGSTKYDWEALERAKPLDRFSVALILQNARKSVAGLPLPREAQANLDTAIIHLTDAIVRAGGLDLSQFKESSGKSVRYAVVTEKRLEVEAGAPPTGAAA